MPDLKKVIRGLECCRSSACSVDCPYLSVNMCIPKLCDDAISLLRKLEPMIPLKVRASTLQEFDGIYKCGSCGHYILLRGQKYCYECGREVKWND